MRRTGISFFLVSTMALFSGLAQAALTLDSSFDTDGIAQVDFTTGLDGARSIAVQADQKIVLVGMSRQGGGTTNDYLALTRLNTDGSIDSTFGASGKVTTLPAGALAFGGADARAVTIQVDGKIVVAGTYNDNSGSGKKLLVARYLANGTLDAAFGVNGIALIGSGGTTPAVAEAVVVQADGRIVVAGRAEPSGDYFRGVIARLESTGAIDTSFATSGVYSLAVANEHVAFRTLDVLGTGDIMASGTNGNLLLVKLTTAGVPNNSFDSDGIVSVNVGTYSASGLTLNSDDGIEGLAVLSDGKLLVAGNSNASVLGGGNRALIARFTTAGVLDTTYGSNGYVTTLPVSATSRTIYDLIALSTGEAIIAGLQFNPTQIHADGTSAVALPGSTGFQAVLRLALQADDKIVAAGEMPIGGLDYQMGVLRMGATALGGSPPDTTPDVFAFVDQLDVALSSTIVSAPVTITGITAAATVTITGGEFSVGCGATYTSVPATITNGQSICVRHTSAANNATATNSVLNIGGVSDTFTSTTLAAIADTTPDMFTFTDQNNVAVASTMTSAAITVSGINVVATVSIAGGEYSIGCNATFTNAAGVVNNGQSICVRHTSAATNSTATNTTLTIGGVSDVFTSTTVAASMPPVSGGDGGGALNPWLVCFLAMLGFARFNRRHRAGLN